MKHEIMNITFSRMQISEPGAGVALIQMQDRAGRNGFTSGFVQELVAAFDWVRDQGDRLRCVVVTGYDKIFSSGGSREELLTLQAGERTFASVPFYRLFLDCEIPVVAAMQGHAIGGGMVLGLYADVVVLSREAMFSANFMNFGFTPGMGATALLPDRLGTALALEMMYTAKGFHGAELKARGVGFSVVDGSEVLNHAMEVAGEIAEKPRLALCLLKQQMSAALKSKIQKAVEVELEMHSQTMKGPDVARKIQELPKI